MATKAYAVKEGQKFAADANLDVVECSSCGITYAIPSSLHASMKKYHGDTDSGWKTFCPMGHTWWYVGETAVEKVERKLRDERARAGRIAAQRDQALADRDYTKRRLSATRGVLTKTKKSVAAGACPCCGKTYQHLARHMHAKHPDYATTEDGAS